MKNIDIDIDIDMDFLENIDIDIKMDFLENININAEAQKPKIFLIVAFHAHFFLDEAREYMSRDISKRT